MVLSRRILAVAAVCGALTASALGAGTATVVRAGNSSLGRIVVSASGRTLYTHAGACTGSCAAEWPPLLVASKPAAGPGVRASLLATVRRGARFQVLYAGRPLSLFSGDRKAGDVLGEGVGGWHAVAPSGALVYPAPAASSAGMGGDTTDTTTMPAAGVNPGMWCAANPKQCVNGVPVTH